MTKKKEEAFKRIVDTIKKQDNDIYKGLTSHSPKTDIKLAFQHCGGHLKDCKDGRYQTFIDEITANYVDAFRAGITNDAHTGDVSTDASDPYQPYEQFEEECSGETAEGVVKVEV